MIICAVLLAPEGLLSMKKNMGEVFLDQNQQPDFHDPGFKLENCTVAMIKVVHFICQVFIQLWLLGVEYALTLTVTNFAFFPLGLPLWKKKPGCISAAAPTDGPA